MNIKYDNVLHMNPYKHLTVGKQMSSSYSFKKQLSAN